MNLTPGLTAWQTSPTPGQCNLSSLRERKVSQWKWWVSMETGLRQPRLLLMPTRAGSECPSIHEVICHDWRGGPCPHAWQAHTFGGRQLSYLSGSASTCCWWFTTSDADSWAHRLGINCAAARRREMSYALFSSSWNNQFLGSSFVMETKYSVQAGGKNRRDWLITRLFPNGLNLLTNAAICHTL